MDDGIIFSNELISWLKYTFPFQTFLDPISRVVGFFNY